MTYERTGIDGEVAQSQARERQVAHVAQGQFTNDVDLCLLHGVAVEIFSCAKFFVQISLTKRAQILSWFSVDLL